MSYKNKKKLGPPPRWIDCPRKGQLIDKKFLPFKTPLDKRYEDQIPEYSCFTLDLLFNSLKSMKLKMGLLIDLTNTNRFYNKDEVEEKFECKYVKLQCRGHGESPDVDQTSTFIDICSRFISQKPLEIIGVHCTHGFNRTGFLISSYLVEKNDWSVDAAVQTYATQRPPGIYKQDYLKELFSRYGDVDDTPPAPPLPAWCNETESQNVDDDGLEISKSSNYSGPKRGPKREFVKKDAKFVEGVMGVSQLKLQPRLAEVQRKVQELCAWKRRENNVIGDGDEDREGACYMGTGENNDIGDGGEDREGACYIGTGENAESGDGDEDRRGDCYNCGIPGHMEKDCQEPSSHRGRRNRSKGEVNSRKCFKCKKTGHLKRDCPQVSTGNERKSCYNCGKSGHVNRNCPEVSRGDDRKKCYSCGKSGHVKRTCHETNRGDDRKKCYNCGELGHVKRNCPKSNSNEDTESCGDLSQFTSDQKESKMEDGDITTCNTCGKPEHLKGDCMKENCETEGSDKK
ncbi:mRNA-capping enzyme-like isoform X7 [Mytilus californianus]|uniref:mRNA-capping enzyme-like isoform X7 n=1 Tax=Mytilus californianus TaxID=6549 RepID=UPI0022455D57|nr:mRNA-capping enzyme-like isoform X7 [Mytilus californianus]